MDEVFKRLAGDGAASMGMLRLPEVILALITSFLLCLLFAYTYKHTHQGLSYSSSFVHTLIMMGVTVAVIMVIIGSNIARAFSLVGALSIIRFRSAIKDPRDVAFLFMVMATGMAVGTGFFQIAVVFAVFACVMVYVLNRFDIGAVKVREMLLKIQLPASVDHNVVLDSIFYKHLAEHTLLSVESLHGGSLSEIVYSIVMRRGTRESEFLDDLRSLSGAQKVMLLVGVDNASL